MFFFLFKKEFTFSSIMLTLGWDSSPSSVSRQHKILCVGLERKVSFCCIEVAYLVARLGGVILCKFEFESNRERKKIANLYEQKELEFRLVIRNVTKKT